MDSEALSQFLTAMPFAAGYGTKIVQDDTEVVCVTEWRDCFTGNPLLKAWHGGIVSGAMELTGLLATYNAPRSSSYSLLSINVNYLKPNRGEAALYTSAKVVRLGKQIVTIETESWQDSQESATACALLTFTYKTCGDL